MSLTVPPALASVAVIKHLAVDNRGWEFLPLTAKPDVAWSEQLQIRGYELEKHEQKVFKFTEPGSYVINE